MARIPFCLVLVGFCACGGRTPIEPGDPIFTFPPVENTGGYWAPTGGNWNTGGLPATGGYFLAGGVPATGADATRRDKPTCGGNAAREKIPAGGR